MIRTRLADAHWRVLEPDPQPYWMKLFQKIPSEDWTGQKLDVTTWKDEMGQFLQFIKGVQWLTLIVVSVLLAVVLVGIFNSLTIAVRERTRGIGTLRAIGMQRGRVLWLMLLESGLLGLCGTLGGAAVAVAIAAALNAHGVPIPESMQMFLAQEKLHFLIQPLPILVQALRLTAFTALVSLVPAFLAARLRPVTAMHHIG
ncbi:MAG: FtsX-like permease family protein [Anaeromyxobacter sp.]